MPMRRKIVISAALVVAIATIGGVLALMQTSKGKAPSIAAAPPTVPVVGGTVTSHDVPIYLRGVGTVIAYNTVIVRSQIQGQITKIAFTEGQSVKAGDLLAQIDPGPYQAQLDQITATRDRDQAQLQNAIKADEALMEAARIQLGYTQLTSPIPGVTGVRQIDLGNVIHPTDPNGLVVVTQLQPISVIFSLPETNLPEVQQQMAKGTLTVLDYSQNAQIK